MGFMIALALIIVFGVAMFWMAYEPDQRKQTVPAGRNTQEVKPVRPSDKGRPSRKPKAPLSNQAYVVLNENRHWLTVDGICALCNRRGWAVYKNVIEGDLHDLVNGGWAKCRQSGRGHLIYRLAD